MGVINVNAYFFFGNLVFSRCIKINCTIYMSLGKYIKYASNIKSKRKNSRPPAITQWRQLERFNGPFSKEGDEPDGFSTDISPNKYIFKIPFAHSSLGMAIDVIFVLVSKMNWYCRFYWSQGREEPISPNLCWSDPFGWSLLMKCKVDESLARASFRNRLTSKNHSWRGCNSKWAVLLRLTKNKLQMFYPSLDPETNCTLSGQPYYADDKCLKCTTYQQYRLATVIKERRHICVLYDGYFTFEFSRKVRAIKTAWTFWKLKIKTTVPWMNRNTRTYCFRTNIV